MYLDIINAENINKNQDYNLIKINQKLSKNLIILNQIYLHIYKHLNKIYYQETALLNINSFLYYE